MIGEHGPGQDRPCAALGQSRNPRDEVGAIGSVPDDEGPLDAAHHDMLQDVRRIEARSAGHAEKRRFSNLSRNVLSYIP